MQPSLMEQGVELMLYGMGTVFVFLALLVAATTAMSAVMQRYVKPEEIAATRAYKRSGKAPQNGADNNEPDPQLLAVISAAIHKYRSRHK